MPPRHYPKLPTAAERHARDRIRQGHITLAQLRLALSSIEGPRAVHDRLCLKFAYLYGLRASEVGLIQMDSFDLGRRTIEIARLKGSKGHNYPLDPALSADLRVWLAQREKADLQSEFLFPHRLDPRYPLDRRSFARIWARAAAGAHLPANLHNPHVLKHSIATHMLDRGNNMRHVQWWLGHASMSSTEVYAELSADSERQGQAVVDSLSKELMGA